MLGGPHYDPNATWEGFWWTALTLNKRMVVHNAAILAPHHWQSKWYEWLLVSDGCGCWGVRCDWQWYARHMLTSD